MYRASRFFLQHDLDQKWITMKTVKRSAILLLVPVIFFLFITACSGPAQIGEAPSEAACSALVNTKCVRCHYKTRICDALGTKSVANWKRSIKFMIKQGAQLTDEEQEKIVACLSSLPRGSDVVCK